eukprot:3835604-Amphidinium_carterae.1
MAPCSGIRTAAKSKKPASGGRWHQILGVSLHATSDEIRKAYRTLALQHHPDKVGGDSDKFKCVQQAYEEGVRKCRSKVDSKTSKGTVQASARVSRTHEKANQVGAEQNGCKESRKKATKCRVVPVTASKARLRAAVERWQNFSETMPNSIPTASAEDMATWLTTDSCMVVDSREAALASVPL